ncbi:MAG: 50S ribosomal protein L22 [Candidatus Poseidoniaceae archaeon]
MGKNARTMNRRDKRRQLPQKGFTQPLQGNRLSVARATNVDVHVKACFEICRTVRGMTAGAAVRKLEKVLLIDSDRPDIRAKAEAIPYRLGSGNKKRKRSGPSMVGHRKGGMGPGRYPVKASRVVIKLLNSAMDNARHQHEDIDAEDMIITHIAAHRGTIKRGFMPRARGRATPKNHYQVNLEIFLEDFTATDDELEDDF